MTTIAIGIGIEGDEGTTPDASMRAIGTRAWEVALLTRLPEELLVVRSTTSVVPTVDADALSGHPRGFV
jgi:hypothetical protein